MSLDSARLIAGAHGPVGPGRGREGRRLRRRAERASTASSPSTWAAPPPTSPSASAASRSITRETARGRVPGAGPVRRGGEHRRGRRLDRLRRRGDRRAARRPAERGGRPGPACYGRGGTEADRHRRQRRARPPAAAAARRRDGARRRRGPRGGGRARQPARARRARGRAPGSSTSSTRACSARCAWSPCRRGCRRREFALVSFGGAGGLHANALAALLGCFPVLVPPESGVLSALGFVAAEIKNEFSQTLIRDADGDHGRRGARAAARRWPRRRDGWLEGERVAAAERTVDYVVDMRYQRQGFEIPIEIAAGELAELTIPALAERFDAVHHRLYGFGLAGGAELVSLRAVARGGCRSPEIPSHDAGPADPSAAQHGHAQPSGPAAAPQEVPDLRPRASCAPACGSRATRSSSSTTPRRSSCPATWPRRPPPQPADRPGGRHEPDRDRPDHPRPDRERAAERALRDGRGRAPRRHVARRSACSTTSSR